MATRVRSFSKINLGLAIGPVRGDRFHGLATLYQSLALHDVVTVSARVLGVGAPTKITLTADHPGVPLDGRNTAWKMAELALGRMGVVAEVEIGIEKRLPVQGGMGAGSANAAAALLGLERELGWQLPPEERLAIAAAVGSDVPLFLIGGAVLGQGRGEVVSPMPDLPPTPCVVAVPEVGVSTPKAFKEWDDLTSSWKPDRLEKLSHVYASVLGFKSQPTESVSGTSGIVSGPSAESEVLAGRARGAEDDLAENQLLALVRTGIENDFEQVVFPQYPLLREIKRELMGMDSGSSAVYAALSGSGSALFGLYRSTADAEAAQQRVQASGCRAILTETLPRSQYWQTMFAE